MAALPMPLVRAVMAVLEPGTLWVPTVTRIEPVAAGRTSPTTSAIPTATERIGDVGVSMMLCKRYQRPHEAQKTRPLNNARLPCMINRPMMPYARSE